MLLLPSQLLNRDSGVEPTWTIYDWINVDMVDYVAIMSSVIVVVPLLAGTVILVYCFFDHVARTKRKESTMEVDTTDVNGPPKEENRAEHDDFRQVLQWVQADSCYELSREFQLMKSISTNWAASSIVAEMMDNRQKNRYHNIIPCTLFFIL